MNQSSDPSAPAIPAPPPRPEDAHKGTFGTVLVVGGSVMMPGVPALCGTAALRSGAGLVKVAAPANTLPSVLMIQPSLTGVSLESLESARGDGKSVVALGPGLGQSQSAAALVRQVLGWPQPLVIDADGLNALSRHPTPCPPGAAWVLTPHPGEFRRLAEAFNIDGDPTDPAGRPDAARRLAEATGAVVVLKGRHTVVTDGDLSYKNHTGNPALSTAGSGDVLTGLIAGLIAQGMTPREAAVLGVHVHGLAADRWAQTHGRRGLLASELADALPKILHQCGTAEDK